MLRPIIFSIFSERRYVLSPVRLSVTLATLLSRLKFLAIFLWHLVPWPSVDIHRKFYGDCPVENPSIRALNTRGVAKYSDFGPIEGYILETVQEEVS